MIRLIFILIFYGSVINSTAQVLQVNNDIQLVHLHDSVFMHVTWDNDETYGRFSSNGLLLIRNGRALMVDTPMDNEKTERLVTWLKDSLSVVVEEVIVGHFHADCLGGLGYLQSIGVKSSGNKLTVEKCREMKLPVPAESFTVTRNFDFHGEEIECRYFGPGHSFDNIVVWIPDQKVLFGGCLVKSLTSVGLGNLSDAVTEEWDTTVKKLKNSYSNIGTVVPGHGDAGGTELLNHTIQLVEAYKSR
jgi:metallo-beta-lactamase class B